MTGYTSESTSSGTADLGRLFGAVLRRWARLLAAAIIIGGIVYLWSTSVTPLYKSESRVLIDHSETYFTRPENAPEQRAEIDERAISSQVQVILSRDLARDVVRSLDLANRAEFDPIGNNGSAFSRILGLFGLVSDPTRLSSEERVLDAYYKRLAVYAVQGSRVIAIEFTSADPQLSAEIANAVADKYIELQQSVRQNGTRQASTWLQTEIEGLRARVLEAEEKVEQFRSQAGLFAAPNNSTLNTQELGEINTQLVEARAAQTEAEAKGELIKQVLASGRAIESLDIANTELIRRLLEQRVTLQAQLAGELRTLLPGHPRIKELNAQIQNFEEQVRVEAQRIARAFENESRLASAQVKALTERIDEQKGTVTSANGQEVQLRSLEREARVQRELLEQFLGRYRAADAREGMTLPPDARVISRASAPLEPFFPKVLPMVLIAVMGTLFLGVGIVVAAELLRVDEGDAGTGDRNVPEVSGAVPVYGSLDRRSIAAQADTGQIEAADARIIRDIAQHLAAVEPGDTAQRILVTTALPDVDAGRIALEMSRFLTVYDRKAIVVDAGANSLSLTHAMVENDVAGLSDLLTGAASFTQAIHRDRDSGVHIIPAGQATLGDRFKSRMSVVTDAIGFTYDFVVLLSSVSEQEDEQVFAQQCNAAILVATGQATDPATVALHKRLNNAGIDDVVVLLMQPESLASNRSAA
jgi:uncharacterized protein involved in exopolysaccharide biosynthesis/Mrp family chromosome partitioning ATPase